MDAKPLLAEIARGLDKCRLEAVLIGNAAAVLRGAPVTTLDFDFFFRKTPTNLRKLKKLAGMLGATVHQPYYPASGAFFLRRDEDRLEIDFMSSIHGAQSFEGLRSRASSVDFDGHALLVASLRDIIKSKKAAGRPRDLAVLEILERAAQKAAEKDSESSADASGAQSGK